MNNRRGIALVLCYIVIMVFLVLFVGGGLVTRSTSETNNVKRYQYSAIAYWLAEAGSAEALSRLPDVTPIPSIAVTVSGKQGYYAATISLLYGVTYEINSSGTYSGVERRIKVVAELPAGSFGSVTNAIETTGDLSIEGSADINPSGSYKTGSLLNFETVFGVSKDDVRAAADHLYTNPATNQQPVDGITWVDLNGTSPQTTTTYGISSNWSGSGLLIIDGHRNDSTDDIPAVEISGNWDFNGLIWVMGKIKITGTPEISGAVFAESAVDVTSTVSGNATLSFSSSDRDSAFGLLAGVLLVPRIRSWSEP